MSNRTCGRGIPANEYSSLRKPGGKQQEINQDGGQHKSDTVSIAKKSLNVEAPEFVPRFTIPAKVVEPKVQPPDQKVVDYVRELLDNLTYNPGEFDIVVDDLTLAWKARIHDISTLKEVAGLIVEQSILQKNFTYTGARLCDLIAKIKDLNDIQESSKSFRSIFLTRCKEEHEKREELLKNPATVPRVHGFAMFLAELYSTFRIGNDTQPLNILSKKLLEMLMTLIKHRSDDSLLYAGRILKLTGSLLDDPLLVNDELSEQKKEVFNEIQVLISSSTNLGRSIKVFLESVITLRNSNWGRENTAVTNSTLSAEAPPFEFKVLSTQPQYMNESEYYYQEDMFGYDTDDITPVSNPDQWNDYCEDDSPDESFFYQNDDLNDEAEEDDHAFTDEMRRDFDKFVLEQHPPPTG